MDSFNFSREKFNKLFPFYILIDQDGRIVSYGVSIAKMCPLESGKLFVDYFIVKRPTLDQGLDVHSLIDQIVILECSNNSKIVLRGQMERTDLDQLLFVGTPWFGNMDQVVENQIGIKDFALHDPMIDLLHVMQTQDINTREIKELLTKVNDQKNVLRESEKRISSIILNLQTGILLEDENKHIVLCNTMFCSLFQIPAAPETLVGMDCSNSAEQSKHMFKNPDQFVERIMHITRERKMVLSEKLALADGRTFERDYMPIFVSNQFKGHMWKYTDITDRENYNEKLRRQEEKYRSIIENMKLGIVEVDLEDHIQYVNSNFCELSGYRPHELIGKKAHEIFCVENSDQIVAEKQALRKRGVSDSYELVIRDKKGDFRWWFISGGPNYNGKGELIGSIGIHLDISEQKILEEELRIAKNKAEESSRAKESFLANMSHEIRTPLNAIIGMVRELKKMDLTTRQSTCVKHADSASQHLLSIINNILDISKIEAGEFHLDKRDFSLQCVFDDTQAIIAPAAREKLLDLQFNASDDLNRIFSGDPHRLRQILLNIISNSVKFTETGSIKVHCETLAKRPDAHDIHIRISDTGIGMDKSYLKTLFKKFSQEDLSIVRKYGGTGLGMAITNELMQMMGGRIEVTSEKGHGSQFDIYLTLMLSDQTNPIASSEEQSNLKSKQLNVLLVEDNELNRLVATNTMSFYGIHTEEAVNGMVAIKILKEKTFDLILMDLQMPVMDGLEATRVIRNELKLNTPIIALTANAFKNEIEKCMAAGMNDYVTKPFEEKMLIDAIHKNTQNKIDHVKPEELPDHTSKTKLYDLSRLIALSHGSTDFMSKMISLFCTSTPPVVHAMMDAVKAGDFGTLNAMAHKIKPSIDNLGIVSIKEEIRMLEKSSAEGNNREQVRQLAEHVTEVISKVIVELAKEKSFA